MRTNSSEYGVSWATQMNLKTATRLNRSVRILKDF